MPYIAVKVFHSFSWDIAFDLNFLVFVNSTCTREYNDASDIRLHIVQKRDFLEERLYYNICTYCAHAQGKFFKGKDQGGNLFKGPGGGKKSKTCQLYTPLNAVDTYWRGLQNLTMFLISVGGESKKLRSRFGSSEWPDLPARPVKEARNHGGARSWLSAYRHPKSRVRGI